jgi:hypothetical protein
MGYYVQLISADFVIPETPEVLTAIKDMDVRFDALKRGGSIGGERNGERWFSWMPQLSTFDTVQDVFVALGFEVDGGSEDNNSFHLTGYDNKTGQEDLFLAVVAPFVKDGSYTSWRGEDGELYRFTVESGRLRVQSATIQWASSEPLGIGHYDAVRGDGTYHPYHIIVDPYEDDADTIKNLIDSKVSGITAQVTERKENA